MRAEPCRFSDFEDAAKRLFCDLAAIRAVAEVEAGGRTGFLKDKRPKILFESRWFHKLTGGIHSQKHPGISTDGWVGNYKGGADEYERLADAMKLDRDAAVKATSWGLFQILRINHRVAGFDKLDDFLRAQSVSEGEHLKAFINFVIHNHLDDELRDRRWDDFARSYNGPGYKRNRYDEKMADAYSPQRRFSCAEHCRNPMALNRNGADLLVDGITGPATRRAIREFQRQHGLVIDGIAGPKTLLALGLLGTHDPVALSATINA